MTNSEGSLLYKKLSPAIKQKEDKIALAELLRILENVDIKDPLAQLNKTSISDNNGGRIEL